jgi:hypothetical protein
LASFPRCRPTLVVNGALTCIHFSSRKCRQTLTSHQLDRVVVVNSRLGSIKKFGSKRTLSVGLQLTAFLRIMNGPDVCITTVCFWAALKRTVQEYAGLRFLEDREWLIHIAIFRRFDPLTWGPFPPRMDHPADTHHTCHVTSIPPIIYHPTIPPPHRLGTRSPPYTLSRNVFPADVHPTMDGIMMRRGFPAPPDLVPPPPTNLAILTPRPQQMENSSPTVSHTTCLY